MGDKQYDLLVIGGGINGVTVAWDAALRGLSVALVEKKDFGHATSANTLRIIHGGLRYIQTFNIIRCIRYIKEQLTFFRIAPHLVKPLPFVIPAYGHLYYGKELLTVGTFLYRILKSVVNESSDINKSNALPMTFSKEECLELLPFLNQENLTGAISYYDSQMINSERIVVSIAKSAFTAGADLANYAHVTNFIRDGQTIIGVIVKDLISDVDIEIHARYIVNTSGPWINTLLSLITDKNSLPNLCMTKAFNIMIKRSIKDDIAFGIPSSCSQELTRESIGEKRRYYFAVPWNGSTIIGTEHLDSDSDPDDLNITEEEIDSFVQKINYSQKSLSISRDEICNVYRGFLPAIKARDGKSIICDSYRILDHEKDSKLRGIISVIGVKYTEARYLAEEVVNLIFRKMGEIPPDSLTSVTPVYGGDIGEIDESKLEKVCKENKYLSHGSAKNLLHNYGSGYEKIVNNVVIDQKTAQGNEDYLILKAEIVHAIDEEMAQNLEDVIFRRISSYKPGSLDKDHLTICSSIMASRFAWSNQRLSKELHEFKSVYM